MEILMATTTRNQVSDEVIDIGMFDNQRKGDG
jgi:hypothetical protein